MERLYASARTKVYNVKHSFKMVVAWFQRKIHVVLDHAAISHGDDLLELHAWVERSTMGCLAWPKLTSQLSPQIDFAPGGICYDPNDHMGRGELSTIGSCCSMLVISMS